MQSKFKNIVLQNILKTNPKSRKINPWWTNKCSTAIKDRRKALKTLNAHPPYAAKRLFWKNFISSINSHRLQTAVCKINSKPAIFSLHCILINNDPCYNTPKTANQFAESYSNISSNDSFVESFTPCKSTNKFDLDFHNIF